MREFFMSDGRRKTSRKKWFCWLLAAVVLVSGTPVSAAELQEEPEELTGFSIESSEAVSAEPETDPDLEEPRELCTVTFAEQPEEDGDSAQEYEELRMEVTEGTEITLPQVPEEEGYKAFGWSLDDEETRKAGSTYVVSGDVTFYAVRQEAYLIEFCDADGTPLAETDPDNQEKWTYQAAKGEMIYFPELPQNQTGYKNLGWSEKKNASQISYAPGEAYTVQGHMKFYLTRGKTVLIKFANPTGTMYPSGSWQYECVVGETITLPEGPALDGWTNLGWASAKNSQKAEYKQGKSYKVTGAKTFYLVRSCSVYFANPAGAVYTGTSAAKFQVSPQTMYAVGGVRVPEGPPLTGYKNLGWTTVKGSSVVEYKAGDYVPVNKQVTLYLIRGKNCKITFANMAGKNQTGYAKYNITGGAGEKVTLPTGPNISGYAFLGWSTKINATSATYAAGAGVTLKSNLNLYAVYKKGATCTVAFNNLNGNTTCADYTKLQKKVTAGNTITIPEGPKIAGYINVGWSTKKGSTTVAVKAGEKYKVTKSQTLYLVRRQGYYVTYKSFTGALTYSTQAVIKGNSVYLPSVANISAGVKNRDGQTLIGWSLKTRQRSKPSYEIGQKITPQKNMVFYPVFQYNNTIATPSKAALLKVKVPSQYGKVIFVGDSRTVRMFNMVEAYLGARPANVDWVAEGSMGFEWLKSTGYPLLLDKLKQDAKGGVARKPTAVIFNIGVNSLDQGSECVQFMNQKAAEMKKYGCQLYYMSVNPTNNSTMLNFYGANTTPRTGYQIISYNNLLKTKLSADYQYLDAYSYLIQSGYAFDRCRYGYDEGIDDGLHYNAGTYMKIYKYCMEHI